MRRNRNNIGSWLCSHPNCPNIVDKPGRCPDHPRPGNWASMPTGGEYGAAWQRARAAQLAARPDCERCGQPASEVHHRNHNARDHSEANRESVCHACHRRITNAWRRERRHARH
jgi:hypothetical protein